MQHCVKLKNIHCLNTIIDLTTGLKPRDVAETNERNTFIHSAL